MMPSLAFSGLWLLVILTGTINGYPTKKDLERYGASSRNPFVSNKKGHGPGYSSAESAFPSASKETLQLHTDEQPGYIHPNAQMRPVPALYGSNVYPAPVYQGFDGGVSVGSTQPRFQSPLNQVQWAVDPPTPFFDRTSPLDEKRFVSEGPGYVGPPGQFPPFQPGEVSFEGSTYEQGDYDSESEDEGPAAQFLPVLPLDELAIGSPLALGSVVDRLKLGYPLIEYMFLNRMYPPGTYTFSTDRLDHRKNQWHDRHVIGDPYRSGHQQLKTFPHQYGKRGSIRPVHQNIGNAGHASYEYYG